MNYNNRGQNHRRPNSKPQQQRPQKALPEFYLKPDERLFDEVAKQWAEAIYGFRGDTKSTQIRQFYEKILDIYEAVFLDNQDFNNHIPFIKMIKSKVAYAKGREVVKGAFEDFMNKGIDEIKTEQDLETFKLLFEVVLGFLKGLEFDKKQELRSNKWK